MKISLPKWQIDRFSHFFAAHGRVLSGMRGHVLSPNNCPFVWGIWAPSNTCFLGSTGVHNPNRTSIGSAVFAQCTSKCHRACRGMPFPSKFPLSRGICIPYNTWFLRSTRLSIPSGLWIGLGIFAQLTAESL